MYREKLQPWLYFLKKKKEKQREGKKQEKFFKFSIKLTWIFLKNTEVIHFYNIIVLRHES